MEDFGVEGEKETIKGKYEEVIVRVDFVIPCMSQREGACPSCW